MLLCLWKYLIEYYLHVFCLCFKCLKFLYKRKIKTVLITSISILLSLPLLEWRTCWMAAIKIHNIATGGILCNDIMSERSKYDNLLQFNTSWLAFLRTWYYFRLQFFWLWPKNKSQIKLLFVFTKVLKKYYLLIKN